MSDLVKKASKVAGGRKRLASILGVESNRLSTRRMAPTVASFLARAPLDPSEWPRFAVRAQVSRLLDDLRTPFSPENGSTGVQRARAFYQGLMLAGQVYSHRLVVRRLALVHDKYRKILREETEEGELLWPSAKVWKKGTVPSLEQSRRLWVLLLDVAVCLRGPTAFTAVDLAFRGIGGEDLTEHAPQWTRGELQQTPPLNLVPGYTRWK